MRHPLRKGADAVPALNVESILPVLARAVINLPLASQTYLKASRDFISNNTLGVPFAALAVIEIFTQKSLHSSSGCVSFVA